ncbi:MAG TPA: hypothetical protein VFM46_19860 [Pseudomonadales bacterium]|nr:hypothetical protein [Pseudomonadales bacterium]
MASCLAGIVAPVVQAAENVSQPQYFTLEINAKTGKTSGQLDWNIASDLTGTSTPNILSELEYSNLDIWKNSAGGALTIERGPLKNIFVLTNFGKGTINSGDGRDSDYDGDNRTQEYSRSHSDITGDSTYDFEMGAGYRWKIASGITLKPAIAYFHSSQNVRMQNGVQEITTPGRTPSAGAFKNLNSTYEAEWNGMWIGGSIEFSKDEHEFRFQFKHHKMDYHSEANWNLRSSFMHPKSFEQWANGDGNSFGVSYGYHFTKAWQLTLDWQKSDFSAEHGTDTVFFSDGDKASAQLNQANWRATGWSVGLQYQF